MKFDRQLLFRRVGLIVGLSLLLITAGIVFIATKLRGDEQVMRDIDRHFQQLEKESSYAAYTANEGEPPEPITPRTSGVRGETNVPDAPQKKRGNKGERFQRRARSAAPPDPSRSNPSHQIRGVRQIAPGTYLLDPNLVAVVQKSPKSFVHGVRAYLIPKGGKPLGFQLSGIRESSALHAIGIRNGDILIAVNGFQLRSIDEAVLAATSLRFADQYRVDIKRGGEMRSFYYRVAAKAK
jgi:hypothetical protein